MTYDELRLMALRCGNLPETLDRAEAPLNKIVEILVRRNFPFPPVLAKAMAEYIMRSPDEW